MEGPRRSSSVGRSRRSPGRPLRWAGAAALLLVATGAARARADLGGEEGGPRRNDALVPVNTEAAALLERGDLTCLRTLGDPGDRTLAWGRAFDAWHEALERTLPGEGVPVGPRCEEEALRGALEARWPDLDGTHERRTESIELALWRRLLALDPGERRAWSRRFSTLAIEGYRAAPTRPAEREAELRSIDHLHPATEGAARAALELFELAFEEGRRIAARTWLERAERHARGAEWTAGLEGVARRRETVAAVAPPPSKTEDPRCWVEASGFEVARTHPLLDERFWKPDSRARIEGPPGAVLLDGGRIALQTTSSVWVLSESESDRAFEPWKVAKELGQPVPSTIGRTGRDWFLLPESDGTHLFLVTGRADESTGNFVQRIKPSRELEIPEASWSLGGAGLYDERGELTPLAEVLGDGLWEFQPGPKLVGDLLLVQARRWALKETESEGELPRATTPGEARAYLLALDAATGRPRWTRFLCRGTDIVSDLGLRFGGRPLVRTPGAPPVVAGDCVFVATELGAAFLLELADGRLLWSFLNRRREAETPGWKGGRPAPVCPSRDGGPPIVLWGPADGDFLYALRAGTDLDPDRSGGAPRAVLAHAPLSIGESELLVGGEWNLALVLGRARARRTLSAHELDTGRRYDSVYLAREETYLPGPLVTPAHVLLATDRGLYRFDRRRELYLELFVPFDFRSDYASGGVWTAGETLYLPAKGELQILRPTDE